MALFRLVYVSTSLLAGDPREREHVAHILMSSRRNNAETEVTGALLATESHFSQVLEGERKAVEETFDRIVNDFRHRDITVVLAEPLNARQFPEWSMAYIGPSQSAAQAVARVTQNVSNCEAGQAARDLVRFMSRMVSPDSDDSFLKSTPAPAAK